MKTFIFLFFAVLSLKGFAQNGEIDYCPTQRFLSKLPDKELFGQTASEFYYADKIDFKIGACHFIALSEFSAIKVTSNSSVLYQRKNIVWWLYEADEAAPQIARVQTAMNSLRSALSGCGCTNLNH